MSHTGDEDLRSQIETLSARLAEAEQTLDALRAGEVDALIVGDDVYTLDSAHAASHQLRSDVLAQMQDAAVAVDDESRVVYLNAAAEAQYRRSASETLGHPLARLFTERWYRDGDATRADEALRQVGIWRGESVHVRSDGSTLHAESTITSLRDSGPVAGGRLVVSRDVSERYRAEAALQRAMRRLARSERHFSTLVENSPFVFTRFDRELRHLYVSPAIEAITGLSPESFIGKTHAQLGLPADLAGAWQTVLRGVFESAAVANTRFSFPTASGALRHYEARVIPELSRDGVVESVLTVASDVTEREVADRERRAAAESLRESDHRKDVFLATLAHELRNPLAPIGNALQVMRLSDDAAARDHAREMIERQLGQLVHLVDDLLDVSRISLGKVELRRERMELSSVIRNAVETSRPLIDAAGHTLETSLAPAPEIVVDGDMTRLTQVVANLLNNAAKYTPAGGRIVVTTRREGDEAVVEVADTGVGLGAEQLLSVFEMFAQVDRASARSKGGLGIGLALVKGLVEMHGGTVSAQSEGPGRGSCFQLRLPALAAGSTPGTGRDGDRTEALGEGLLVLIADDNRDAADSMAMMLELMDFETVVAYDGDEALQVASRSRPLVAVLDIGMPRLDGLEVARRLRAGDGTRDMTLIALSGWGRDDDRRRTREAGFDHHLVKPVDLDVLADLLVSAGADSKASP